MKVVVLNQVSGVLFYDICNSLNKSPEIEVELHSEPEKSATSLNEGIKFFPAPKYNKRNYLTKITSWLKFCLYASRIYLSSGHDDKILISSNPPLLLHFLYFINYFKKRSFSIIVYDIYPEIIVEMGIFSPRNFLVKIWKFINKKAFFRSEKIYTITKKMKDTLIMNYQLDHKKIDLLEIWVDTKKYRPIPRDNNNLIRELNSKKKLVVTYSGNFGISHDHMTFLKAIKKINNRLDIVFIICGGGKKYILAQKFVNRHNIKNVKFLNYQSESDYIKLLSMSHISIVSQAKGSENSMIPSKTFFCMSVECAIFCITSIRSELCKLVISAKCGQCFRLGDHDSLANELIKSIESKELLLYGKRGRKYILKHHNKQEILSKFSLGTS